MRLGWGFLSGITFACTFFVISRHWWWLLVAAGIFCVGLVNRALLDAVDRKRAKAQNGENTAESTAERRQGA
jgi:hypothetical protein